MQVKPPGRCDDPVAPVREIAGGRRPVVTTSNRRPSISYKDGLKRELSSRFIDSSERERSDRGRRTTGLRLDRLAVVKVWARPQRSRGQPRAQRGVFQATDYPVEIGEVAGKEAECAGGRTLHVPKASKA